MCTLVLIRASCWFILGALPQLRMARMLRLGRLSKLPRTYRNEAHNLVGILDDRIAHRRWMQAQKLNEEKEEYLRRRGQTERHELSRSVALPIFEAAVDEEREVLRGLWARLLANACDPNRHQRVRVSFIETIRKFEPIDALVLQMIGDASGPLKPSVRDYVAGTLRIQVPEVMVSFEALEELKCLWHQTEIFNPIITDRGRLILAAVAP